MSLDHNFSTSSSYAVGSAVDETAVLSFPPSQKMPKPWSNELDRVLASKTGGLWGQKIQERRNQIFQFNYTFCLAREAPLQALLQNFPIFQQPFWDACL